MSLRIEIWGQLRVEGGLLGNHIIMGPDADIPSIVISENSDMARMCEWKDIRDRPVDQRHYQGSQRRRYDAGTLRDLLEQSVAKLTPANLEQAVTELAAACVVFE